MDSNFQIDMYSLCVLKAQFYHGSAKAQIFSDALLSDLIFIAIAIIACTATKAFVDKLIMNRSMQLITLVFIMSFIFNNNYVCRLQFCSEEYILNLYLLLLMAELLSYALAVYAKGFFKSIYIVIFYGIFDSLLHCLFDY